MKPPERETLKLLRLNPVTDTQRPLKELHHLFQGLKCRQGGKKRERESGSIRDPAVRSGLSQIPLCVTQKWGISGEMEISQQDAGRG